MGRHVPLSLPLVTWVKAGADARAYLPTYEILIA